MARIIIDLDTEDVLKLLEKSVSDNPGQGLVQFRSQLAAQFMSDHIKGSLIEDIKSQVNKSISSERESAIKESLGLLTVQKISDFKFGDNVKASIKQQVETLIGQEIISTIREWQADVQKKILEQIGDAASLIDRGVVNAVNNRVNELVTQRLQAILNQASPEVKAADDEKFVQNGSPSRKIGKIE